MPGRRSRPRRIAPVGSAALAAALLLAGCGPTAPDADAIPSGPPDLADLVGSWTALVSDEEVWQGRWRLHVQGAVALLEGPDRKLRSPGLVVAAARGVVVFGRDQACPEQVAVTSATYTYESRGEQLAFRLHGADSCVDRLTVLTNSTWTRVPVQAALPIRVDVAVDPGCAALADGTAPVQPPRVWTLQNLTAGIVLAMRQSAGEVVLLGQALPGEDIQVEPRRGGISYVTDLTGRCLSLVDDAAGVRLQTGAKPQRETE